jgi:hypothetical protein
MLLLGTTPVQPNLYHRTRTYERGILHQCTGNLLRPRMSIDYPDLSSAKVRFGMVTGLAGWPHQAAREFPRHEAVLRPLEPVDAKEWKLWVRTNGVF